ncbi:MAG: chemotaxis protein CheW [Negativicutes bacterium]
MIVTEVTEVLLLSGEQIEDAPLLAGSNECIRGVGKTANRLLIILDLSQLLSVDELEAIVVA